MGIAAFLSLAHGLKTLSSAEESIPENNKLSANTDHTGEEKITPPTDGVTVSPQIRATLGWGSLLMGIAFAHAGLGLPMPGPFLYEIWSCPRPYGRDHAGPRSERPSTV